VRRHNGPNRAHVFWLTGRRSYFAQADSHRATVSVERRPNRSSIFFERPSNGLNNMLGLTVLEQIRDDRVAQSNPLHLAPDPPIARSRLKMCGGRQG
jgi:hypothetical protein